MLFEVVYIDFLQHIQLIVDMGPSQVHNTMSAPAQFFFNVKVVYGRTGARGRATALKFLRICSRVFAFGPMREAVIVRGNCTSYQVVGGRFVWLLWSRFVAPALLSMDMLASWSHALCRALTRS